MPNSIRDAITVADILEIYPIQENSRGTYQQMCILGILGWQTTLCESVRANEFLEEALAERGHHIS